MTIVKSQHRKKVFLNAAKSAKIEKNPNELTGENEMMAFTVVAGDVIFDENAAGGK